MAGKKLSPAQAARIEQVNAFLHVANHVKGMVAEGDKVAVEVESLGTLRNGRVYNNEYHTLLTIRDDKICAVREYLDTFHVHATWFEAAPAA